MAASPKYLFVYGTLRRGSTALGEWQQRSGAQFVGRGSISAELYDLGKYPGALRSSSSKTRGEVYLLTRPEEILKRLDRYEGYDVRDPEESLFVRQTVTVKLQNGKTLMAWVYFFNKAPSKAKRISSGQYRKKSIRKQRAA